MSGRGHILILATSLMMGDGDRNGADGGSGLILPVWAELYSLKICNIESPIPQHMTIFEILPLKRQLG